MNQNSIDEIPTKDSPPIQKQDNVKISKTTTDQGQDEISVMIDMDQEEKSIPQSQNKPLLNTNKDPIVNRRKKTPNKDENPNLATSTYTPRHKSPAPASRNPKSTMYKTQTNINLRNISPSGDDITKINDAQQLDAAPNNTGDKALSPWMTGHVYYPSSVSQGEQVSSRLRNIATDTFELDRRREEEIRLLKESIDDLECQSKIKDREIETNKWIEKEMQRRLQSAGDFFSLKNQLKELQRNLDIQERLNQDLTADNARLYDEMGNKDRTILELQSEVNNLDKIVASKKYLNDSEEKKKMLDSLDNAQREIMDKNHEITEANQRLANLQREIDKKDKEIHFKNIKLDEQVEELNRMQNDMAESERRNFTLRESFKSAERDNEMMEYELKKLDELQQAYPKLEDENMYLKQTIRDMEEQFRLMEKRQDSSYQMNTVLEELRQAMLEKNRANEERNHLAEKLRSTEAALKEKSSEERALSNEIEKLKNFVRDLEEENALYRKFEREVGDLEQNWRDSERARNALESQLIQLKPKIQRLQVKSLEKDHLITQLVQELKAQVGYLPSDLRKEISRNETGSTKIHGHDLLDQRDRDRRGDFEYSDNKFDS